MSKRLSVLVAILPMVVVFAQAGGSPGTAPKGGAQVQSHGAASGGNAMEKGRSGNSGPGAKALGGSNALSGSGRKKKQP